MSVVRELCTNYEIDGIHWIHPLHADGRGYPPTRVTRVEPRAVLPSHRLSGTRIELRCERIPSVHRERGGPRARFEIP